MKLVLDKVFDSPRSSFSNPEQSNAVGTYLFRKLGRLGLLVHMHLFQDREESSNGNLADDVSSLNNFLTSFQRCDFPI